jgi:hypothetical protein
MRRRRPLGSHESDELLLWIDNDEPLYLHKQRIQVNLTKKVCAGRFSKARAAIGFSYVTQPAADQYRREVGEKIKVADRREADRDLVKEYLSLLEQCRAKGRCADLPKMAQEYLASNSCQPGPAAQLSGPKRRRR